LFPSLFTLGKKKASLKRWAICFGICGYLSRTLLMQDIRLSSRLRLMRTLQKLKQKEMVLKQKAMVKSKKRQVCKWQKLVLLHRFPVSQILLRRFCLILLVDTLLWCQQTKKKTKTVVEKYWDWELTNETQPIWVRILTV
jgi:hypothetical protein